MQELGYNYRLSDIHAVLGLSQLGRAKENLEKRREIAARYDDAFAGIEDLKPLGKNKRTGHAFHLYVVLTSQRKVFYEYLKNNNIMAQVHYLPVNLLPYYRKLGYPPQPFSEAYYAQCISLPMSPGMNDEEIKYVISSIKNFK